MQKPRKYLNLKESAPEGDDQEECIPEEDECSQAETEGDKPKIDYGLKYYSGSSFVGSNPETNISF